MKKALPWIALALALMWIIHNPAGAGTTIHTLVTGLATFAAGL